MAKVTKPTKPTAPREPKKPEKVYVEIHPMSVNVGYQSLADLLREIKERSTQRHRHERDGQYGLLNSQALGIDLEKVQITHSGYGEGYEATWQQPIEYTLTDAEYTKRLKRYDKTQLPTYKAKLAEYEKSLARYEENLAKWEAVQAAKQEAAERAQLKRLQAKYKA